MLVNFIGSPLSGKTTIAAAVFASLKSDGYPTEFVSERARYHIARKRVLDGKNFKLTDEDQVSIFKDQFEHEDYFKRSGEDSIVLADAAPILALLYMTDEGLLRFTSEEKDLITKATANMQVIFLCDPIRTVSDIGDPNRLHTLTQNLEIHSKIPDLIAKYAPNVATVVLSEKFAHNRTSTALSAIYTHLLKEVS